MGTGVRRLALLPAAFVLEELEIARSALEGGKPAWTPATTLDPAAATERGCDRRCADEPPDEERPDGAALLLAVHGLILGL
jgi:hypothetical protein